MNDKLKCGHELKDSLEACYDFTPEVMKQMAEDNTLSCMKCHFGNPPPSAERPNLGELRDLLAAKMQVALVEYDKYCANPTLRDDEKMSAIDLVDAILPIIEQRDSENKLREDHWHTLYDQTQHRLCEAQTQIEQRELEAGTLGLNLAKAVLRVSSITEQAEVEQMALKMLKDARNLAKLKSQPKVQAGD